VNRCPELNKNPARRRTLDHERSAADQNLEWGPVPEKESTEAAEPRCRGRRNVLSREERSDALEPALRPVGLVAGGEIAGGGYGRRSVLLREVKSGESFPTPRGGADGFGKKNLLSREMGLNGAVAAR
jgi:hypothetical protein